MRGLASGETTIIQNELRALLARWVYLGLIILSAFIRFIYSHTFFFSFLPGFDVSSTFEYKIFDFWTSSTSGESQVLDLTLQYSSVVLSSANIRSTSKDT
ncbi:unnamed protein product [Hermetia illucens]|uniref:Uncharacterized protein n=1 Tax=Hermetia illucens TaxID=343691 RepID=A0A7R8UUV6_HERIL|nr:unnamed protein product [Hermetia illucens]